MDRHLTCLHLSALWSMRISCATVKCGQPHVRRAPQGPGEHVEARPVQGLRRVGP
jgi:hypothetical protein